MVMGQQSLLRALRLKKTPPCGWYTQTGAVPNTHDFIWAVTGAVTVRVRADTCSSTKDVPRIHLTAWCAMQSALNDM